MGMEEISHGGVEEEGACFYQRWKNFPVHGGLTKDDLCISG